MNIYQRLKDFHYRTIFLIIIGLAMLLIVVYAGFHGVKKDTAGTASHVQAGKNDLSYSLQIIQEQAKQIKKAVNNSSQTINNTAKVIKDFFDKIEPLFQKALNFVIGTCFIVGVSFIIMVRTGIAKK